MTEHGDLARFYEAGNLDTGHMDRDALIAHRQRLRALLGELDALEPEDEQSEAYEQWAELHEDMEDLVDEIGEWLDD